MDVKGAQALKDRLELTADDDNRADVRVLVGSVGFLVQCQREGGAYDTAAMGEIDRFGHISLRRTKPHGATTLAEHDERVAHRNADMTNALLDEGLAEWRDVGSGDTELYATQELLRLVAPALAALPRDWQRWPR